MHVSHMAGRPPTDGVGQYDMYNNRAAPVLVGGFPSIAGNPSVLICTHATPYGPGSPLAGKTIVFHPHARAGEPCPICKTEMIAETARAVRHTRGLGISSALLSHPSVCVCGPEKPWHADDPSPGVAIIVHQVTTPQGGDQHKCTYCGVLVTST
jgi:hypothetical protein